MTEPSMFCNLIAVGTALPKKVLGNEELEKFLNLDDNWIVENMGVRERKICSGKEDALYLAAVAATAALKNANCTTEDIDLVVVVTSTSAHMFPGISYMLMDYLGIKDSYGLDVIGNCGGFLSALSVAKNALDTKAATNALVVGVDTLTKVVNWEDPISTLFGDGAGAIILRSSETTRGGIIDTLLKTTSKHSGTFSLVSGNISSEIPRIVMHEEKFIELAVGLLLNVVPQILERNHLSMKDLAWFIPQQVHGKILEQVCKELGIKQEQIIVTLGEHGNTGAGSIPLALGYGVQSNLFKVNDKILLLEIGAGLSGGATLMECNDDWFNLK